VWSLAVATLRHTKLRESRPSYKVELNKHTPVGVSYEVRMGEYMRVLK